MSNNCKKLRNEPFMSPNNYDLEFDSNKIPANIQIEKGVNLEKRLQKLMPLGKIIHVDSASTSTPQNNMISIFSNLNLKKTNGELICEVDFI
ncbi:hypothetical protein [uncultured Methanobrevibacter sp.]|uniref:hypothetical protein n=1 Tax=uncultured Methanobrevibacter sp. TaxID=253161 RepID=UPI0025E0B9EE|nr:hypothetical protein [uncultured Methanobrevibacter sp.]